MPDAFEPDVTVRSDVIVRADPNHDRFSGFADLYDAYRPTVPAALGPLLCQYARTALPIVVDLGSGTGLSTRWAAVWAAEVIGIEPNDDMRSRSMQQPLANVAYRSGTSAATGLPEGTADLVLAVQAMHWMDPAPTHAEMARILRPGGVVAIVDADWPPVVGNSAVEGAWDESAHRQRVLEARVVQGLIGEALTRPNEPDEEIPRAYDSVDPHQDRVIPGGIRSWSKAAHLERLHGSGLFTFCRELLFHERTQGSGAGHVQNLMRSQGSYQGLRRGGLSDADLGMDRFDEIVAAELSVDAPVSFCWRVRIGVRR